MTTQDTRHLSAFITDTGTVTIHFRSGQPVSFHGTVTRWRTLLRSQDRPWVMATGMKLPYVDWPNVTAITVKEDPGETQH